MDTGDGSWSRQFRTDPTMAVAASNGGVRLLRHLDQAVPDVTSLPVPDPSLGTPLKGSYGKPVSIFAAQNALVTPVIDSSDRLQMLQLVTAPLFGDFWFPVGNPSVPISTPSLNAPSIATVGETAPGGGNVLLVQGSNLWMWTGNAWLPIVGPNNLRRVWGDSVDPGHAYAVDSDGAVWRTIGGALLSWKKDPLLTELAGGNGTFTLPGVCGFGEEQLCSVAFDPDHPGTIAAGTAHDGILVSNNDGASWSKAPAIPEPNGGVVELYFDPAVGPKDENGLAAIWGQGLWAVNLVATQVTIPNPVKGGSVDGQIVGMAGEPITQARLEVRIVDVARLYRNVAATTREAALMPPPFPPSPISEDGERSDQPESIPFAPMSVVQTLLPPSSDDTAAAPPVLPNLSSEVVADFIAPTPTNVDGSFRIALPDLRPGHYFVQVIFAGDERNPRTTAGADYDVPCRGDRARCFARDDDDRDSNR